jgi:hypothetical protein
MASDEQVSNKSLIIFWLISVVWWALPIPSFLFYDFNLQYEDYMVGVVTAVAITALPVWAAHLFLLHRSVTIHFLSAWLLIPMFSLLLYPVTQLLRLIFEGLGA